MIQELCNLIYTVENIERAKEYLRGRKINPDLLRYPPIITGKDSTPYSYFQKKYHPEFFTDCLYFPIVDITDSKRLIGFDVRYVGADPKRPRYYKLKDDPNSFLLHFTEDLDKIEVNKPLIVVEGIIDGETLRDLGFPVLSPLTAMHSLKFCCFLKAISNNIYICYDNDEAGKKSVANILQEISIDPDFRKCFKFLNYSGKDVNQAAKDYGKDYILNILKAQII